MPEDPPVNAPPVVFKPETFARHHAAVEYVEGLIRTRAPLPGTGRFPGNKPGAWGLLHPGDTITAGSGLTLGSGTVTLCTQSGSTLTDTGHVVTVFNSGAEISGGAYGYGDGLAVALEWTEAGWSACECGAPSPFCAIEIIVLTCGSPGLPVAGATVTVRQGTTVIGTCTTDSVGGGGCSVDITATGTGWYNVAVTKAGWFGSNKTIHCNCAGTTPVELTASNSTGLLSVTINGCNAGLPGVTLTINGGTYTTDASGQITIALPNGTFPWTASKPPRWADLTGTVSMGGCGFPSITEDMTPADGYACFYKSLGRGHAICNEALANPLTYTGPTGTVSIYFDAPTFSAIGCGTFTTANVDAVNNPLAPCGLATITAPMAFSIQWLLASNTIAIGTQVTGHPHFGSSSVSSCNGSTGIIFDKRCSGATIGAGAASSAAAVTCPPSTFGTHGTFSGSTSIYTIFNGGWVITE